MSLVQDVELSIPQHRLVATPFKFPAFVGGFGSGKTEALISRALMLKLAYPKLNIGYYLPTFDLVRLIALPRFEEKLDKYGIPYKSTRAPSPGITIKDAGQIIFRTMDNPDRIVGYEHADALIDEIDVLKPKDALNAWNKILARNRQRKTDGKPNTIAVGTTPEGFKFVYERWGKDIKPEDGYELIRAATYSNPFLPADYVSNLMAQYPTNLIQAYIDGEFVNLTSGSVYPEFDRVLNGSTEVVSTYIDKNGKPQPEDLHIGMDFNVTKMAAVVFVRRKGEDGSYWPHAVAEITKQFDTPAMILAIKRRFPNNRVFIYPDASGAQRKTNQANTSDIALLRLAFGGANVMHNASNPTVRDRVLAMNLLIKNAKGDRRLKVNVTQCPEFVESLEKQVYDTNGEPDKTSGLDHAVDAGGYFVAYSFPVRGTGMSRLRLSGV